MNLKPVGLKGPTGGYKRPKTAATITQAAMYGRDDNTKNNKQIKRRITMEMISVIGTAAIIVLVIRYFRKMEQAWKVFDEQYEIAVESTKKEQKVDGWIDQFSVEFWAAADKDGAVWLYSQLPVRNGNNWDPVKGSRYVLMPEFNHYLGKPLRWEENPMLVKMHLCVDKMDIKSDRCMEAKKTMNNNNTEKQ